MQIYREHTNIQFLEAVDGSYTGSVVPMTIKQSGSGSVPSHGVCQSRYQRMGPSWRRRTHLDDRCSANFLSVLALLSDLIRFDGFFFSIQTNRIVFL